MLQEIVPQCLHKATRNTRALGYTSSGLAVNTYSGKVPARFVGVGKDVHGLCRIDPEHNLRHNNYFIFLICF